MRRSLVALAASGAAVLMLAGCAEEAAAPRPQQQQEQPQQEKEEPAVPAGEFGAACDAVPKDGPGSFSGMAQDPVATAASNNPVLSTLVAAVTAAGLGDTLNSTQDITVFAPTNDAFAKIPKADLDAVLADKAKLTSILTYHVVGKRIAPEDLASGSFETLQKGMVETSGSGESYTVNDASVVCGNVQTANATVYIIDTVLMPAS